MAVYDQIVRQVKFAVADGAVAAGELVPSVRELARELAINPNTVARAYRQLQDDGVLEAVRGTGLAVAAAARRQCQVERTKLIRARLRLVLAEAVHSGLDAQEIEQLVRAESAAARRNKPNRRGDPPCHRDRTRPSDQAIRQARRRFDDVSLAVPPGVVFALLGENGAGKTTAIRLMLGLAEPRPARCACWAWTAATTVSRFAAASAICPSGLRSTNG